MRKTSDVCGKIEKNDTRASRESAIGLQAVYEAENASGVRGKSAKDARIGEPEHQTEESY
jgi:hypothetical protein